jgi:hypothetical protein
MTKERLEDGIDGRDAALAWLADQVFVVGVPRRDQLAGDAGSASLTIVTVSEGDEDVSCLQFDCDIDYAKGFVNALSKAIAAGEREGAVRVPYTGTPRRPDA